MRGEGAGPARTRGEWALATLAALVVTLPVATHPSAQALGLRYVDAFGTQWWFWYAGELLAGRAGIDHTDLLFWPAGKDVFAHTGLNLLDAMLALPGRLLLGQTLGYNLWIAVVVATNVLAGCRLGRAFGLGPGWPAGLVLALNPYVLREIEEGRPTQAWLALPALALAGVWAAEQARGAALAGLALALAGWQYWYYGMMLGAAGLVVGGARLVRSDDRPRHAALLAVAAAVTVAGVLPAVIHMRAALGAGEVPGLLALGDSGPLAPLQLVTAEGDEAGFNVLSALRGVSGSVVDSDGLRFLPGSPALSFAALGAGAVGAVLSARHRPAAVAVGMLVALLGLWVAVGPAVVVGDRVVRNEPWIALAASTDALRRWWWPGRAVALVLLGLAMLAPGIGRLGRGAWLLPLALAVELGRTGNVPLSTWDARVPAPLVCLRDEPGGTVIDLPFLSDQRNLWFQTVHGHPILGGMLVKKAAFGSGEVERLRAENDFLDLLLDLGEIQLRRDTRFDEADKRSLVEAGYRWVVVDKTRFEGAAAGRQGSALSGSVWPRVERLLRPAIGDPAAEDEQVAVYSLGGSRLTCPP